MQEYWLRIILLVGLSLLTVWLWRYAGEYKKKRLEKDD